MTEEEKHYAESVCIVPRCGRGIWETDGGWVHWAWPEEEHKPVPPLMLDDTRILAYDAGNDVFLLKLNTHQLICVRAALAELAERKHPTTDWQGARNLYDQITEEMP